MREMVNHPLAEVFGFPVDDGSAEAVRYRRNRLCPFNNKVPNCTKDKANNPLGVCSIFSGNQIAVTCPIRFRQDWLIAENAASFFFGGDANWTSLTEVRLRDKNGGVAGNIDLVLVSYDQNGRVTDFGSLEVQAVYISGNIRRPFEYYMESPSERGNMDWRGQTNYPRPDYLSSSRKRLAPQLLYKGSILSAWNKKMAVALDKGFYSTLPELQETDQQKADLAWFVYDLRKSGGNGRYTLVLDRTVYTTFHESLNQITRTDAGDPSEFLRYLQTKLDEKLDNSNAPDNQTLDLEL